MSTFKSIIQIASISSALLGAGGIAALSAFSVPILQSQPANRALPSIRWLFSRGSHIFPQAAIISAGGSVYLAYAALPKANRGILQLLRFTSSPVVTNGYLLAAVLALGIIPVTSVMIPTNFELIRMNAEKGGARSTYSARHGGGGTGRSAEDSTNGKGEAGQFTDVSGPQAKTSAESSMEEDGKVGELLEKFKWLNWGRAFLLGSGGIVGLVVSSP